VGGGGRGGEVCVTCREEKQSAMEKLLGMAGVPLANKGGEREITPNARHGGSRWKKGEESKKDARVQPRWGVLFPGRPVLGLSSARNRSPRGKRAAAAG